MPFAFRHQPLHSIYLVGNILILLLVRLPLWTLANLIPSWRPRPSWSLGRVLIVSGYRAFLDIMYSTTLMGSESLEKAALSAQSLGFVWVEAAPDFVLGEIREIADANSVEACRTGGFWYGPTASGEAGRKASPGEKVIYHLHGGGYMSSVHPSNLSMITCFKGFLEFFPHNPRIFTVEYQISSAPPFSASNPFPAALIDAVAGYRYLVETLGFLPSNVIISGDSAGGHLAFVLARYLAIHELPNLPVPGGLLLLSPTVDWAVTHVGPNSSMWKNTRSDFVHAIFTSEYSKNALLGTLPSSSAATSPWISPASLQLKVTPGMYAGLPKTCIVAGGAEMTLDPMRTLRDRMQEDMGTRDVTYIETPDATHDFFTASWHEPERTNTLREVADWVGSFLLLKNSSTGGLFLGMRLRLPVIKRLRR
ncbi:alpha/beta-hydrolase [Sparassis crispa]|uniref:Alpha/beta-hydrolase n=1 Tax=Sparassis crispa TaxID=139825 RepID=A0A401G9Y6_9APHY|nr:alpha/beta-hydrolase [Sparassis crispa]GBE78982.1 alpha/beta-hydrolase [Sparassis crispa]